MDSEIIDQAVEALECGEVIAVPTETVYGLAADATNPDALERLYDLKNRPKDQPTSIQIAHVGLLNQFVSVPDFILSKLEQYWPGPLTVIFDKKQDATLASNINLKDNSVGVRIPDHPLTLEILKRFAKPLAVPSANPAGEAPPTDMRGVKAYYPDQLAAYIDGGACITNQASTIVKVTGTDLLLIREGPIPLSDLAAV